MKISIIITARNYGQYLTECIESCKNQTVKPYEIIYSDDCSDDNSVKIAKSLGVKVIENKKWIGVVKARNKGFDKSKGDYIIFVDGDDKLELDYIERMLEVLDDDTTLVYSIVQEFGELNKFIDFNCERNNFIWKKNYINTSSLIRRDKFIEAGKWKELDINTHWDWHLFLRLSRLGKFKKSRAVLNYRRHSDSNLFIFKQRHGLSQEIIKYHIINSIVNITIGTIYSGRIPELFTIWMDNLVDDISIIENKPQLIIINNSGNTLNVKKWNNKFSEIKIIRGNEEKIYIKERRQYLSTLLADAYNTILENATGEIIHLREDDNTTMPNAFKIMYSTLISKEDCSATAAIYLSRHQKRLVGGYHIKDNDIVLITEKEMPNKPIKVDFTGTGCIMFWKDICPNFDSITEFGNKSHDWAWCLKLKKLGGKILLLPNAISKHHLTKDDFLIPHINKDNYKDLIIPAYTHTKITNQEKKDENIVIRKPKWNK
jgi:glycosyltransferase involved in cell wall biosynthesis